MGSAEHSPDQLRASGLAFVERRVHGDDAIGQRPLTGAVHECAGHRQRTEPQPGLSLVGGDGRLGDAVPTSTAPLVVGREPDLGRTTPREDQLVQTGGGGVAQDWPGTKAQQHGHAIDQVPLTLVRRHQIVRPDVDALPESRPSTGTKLRADVLDPVSDP
jgi:hypothetical protein